VRSVEYKTTGWKLINPKTIQFTDKKRIGVLKLKGTWDLGYFKKEDILLGHLLKWQFQPEKRTNSWLGTIREQRVQIRLLLEDSPSLKPYLNEIFPIAYEQGLALAIRETELGEQVFPEICPYNPAEALNQELLTENC
jgi:hypothetical protein